MLTFKIFAYVCIEINYKQQPMAQKIINYGRELEKQIAKRNLEKKAIYNDVLDMHPQTFEKRLVDGLFTQEQLLKLQKAGYL